MDPQKAQTKSLRDAKDLLLAIPSLFSNAGLLILWRELKGLPDVLFRLGYVGSLLTPLVALYTLGILILYARRRNPAGVFLAVASLPVLGFAALIAINLLIHGIAVF